MIHHCNEQIEQDDDVDDRVCAKHKHAPEASEAADSGQLEVIQIDQAKHSPEQCLRCLEQTVDNERNSQTSNRFQYYIIIMDDINTTRFQRVNYEFFFLFISSTENTVLKVFLPIRVVIQNLDNKLICMDQRFPLL